MSKLGTYATCLAMFAFVSSTAQQKVHPNVVLIITDDQGYGDLGFTGNTQLKTPVLDALAKESVRFRNYNVSPVCALTRASLMTGRYSLRTGVRDTNNGGCTMASEEVTIAEMLKQAGYKTGLFGKWHLGDNFPGRPMDQGFDESLMHLGGGMGQVGDVTTYFKNDSSYFDPVLWHNGKQEAHKGYCSDVFTENAIRFIERNKQSPFFCYLAFNAPHTPLQVPDRYYQVYAGIDPTIDFEKNNPARLQMTEQDKEDARRVYAMVANVDENIGRLLHKLNELGLAENTIVMFMTDNGPQQLRYNAGMKGKKADVYRGGTRVPFYFRYPGLARKNSDIEEMAAHIDILPTIADLCNAPAPKDRKLDGRSLVPLIKGEVRNWPDRTLFSYWTRAYPELYSNIAVQNEEFKLVGQTNYNARIEEFELYNIRKDPLEQHNIISDNLGIAKKLKAKLDSTYRELIVSEHMVQKPRIIIGSPNENPVILNRNDADGDRGIWAQEVIYGKWNVQILQGCYNARFKFLKPVAANGRMFLQANSIVNVMENKQETDWIEMKNICLPEISGDLVPFYMSGGKRILPFWVELERID